MDNRTHIVIMAGGIGSRLWPESTPSHPKQFMDVTGCGKSLIRLTVERFLPLCPMSNFWVVTNEAYVGEVASQLPEIPLDNILAEPAARNTAPCIAYAAWKIARRYPDANIAVVPSDAYVDDVDEFRRVISEGLGYTLSHAGILTIGITPDRPETAYGYISADGAIQGNVRKVESFKEKPNLETAKAYLQSGNYFWNAGIFISGLDFLIASIRRFEPDLAAKMDSMSESFYTESEKEIVGRVFPTCEKISIDYAVMEKSDEIAVLPASFGWSDLGNWSAVRAHSVLDADGNALTGSDVRVFESSGNIVHVGTKGSVIIDGLEGYIVAERDGNILICPMSHEQKLRDFLK